MSADSFWNHPNNNYGARHTVADRSATNQRFRPGALIVFVHGIRDDRWCFEPLPELLVKRLGFDADMVAFEYPSYTWLKASIENAANDLRDLLKGASFRHYSQLYFVAHSAGGLVVKRLLVDEMREALSKIRGIKDSEKDFEELDSIALRTMRVVNIAVPHRGGAKRLTAVGNWVYEHIYYPCRLQRLNRAIARLISRVKVSLRIDLPKSRRSPIKNRELGRNLIIAQLDHRNTLGSLAAKENNPLTPEHPDRDTSYLDKLEMDYFNGIIELRTRGLHAPVAVEICGTDDSVVPATETYERKISRDGREILIRAIPESNQTYRAETKNRNSVYVRTDRQTSPDADETDAEEPTLEAYQLRGTHGSVKLTNPETQDLIIDILHKHLHHCVVREDFYDATAALLTLAKNFDFEREQSIDHMLGGVDSKAPPNDERRTVKRGVHAFSQRGASRWLGGQIRTDGGSGTLLLTGDAGVGKSAVFRRVGRELAVNYLAIDTPNARLPILLPLQAVKIEDNELVEFRTNPWEILRRELIKLANRLIRQSAERAGLPKERQHEIPSLAEDWLDDRLKTLRSVLMLDGIDDFLSNNLDVEFGDVLRLQEKILGHYSQNDQLKLVLGARSSQLGLAELAGDTDTAEILRLSVDEAEREFSGTRELINQVGCGRLSDLLLTPLIFSELGPDIRDQRITAGRLQTRSDIMEEALKAIMNKDGLSTVTEEGGDPIPLSAWLDAAMLVADRFYRESLATLHRDQIRLGSCLPFRTPPADYRTSDPIRELRRACSSIICHHEPSVERETSGRLNRLLRGSVFLPTSRGVFRFVHREWEEYLVARFVATCIRLGLADQLGENQRALTKNMFEYAGELLLKAATAEDWKITEKLVQQVLRESINRGNQYIAGNFVATLGNTFAPFENRDTIRYLLDKAPNIEEVARHTLLNTLGFRVLTKSGKDESWDDLFEELDNTYRSYLNPNGPFTSQNDVTRSMIWCYLQAFHKLQFGALPPVGSWPGLGREHECAALRMVCSQRPDGSYTYDRRQHSLQRAYLSIQNIITKQPCNEISVTHYLYIVSAAFRNRGHITGAKSRLAEVLQEKSDLATEVGQFTSVPQLMKIIDYCRWAANDGRSEALAHCPDVQELLPDLAHGMAPEAERG